MHRIPAVIKRYRQGLSPFSNTVGFGMICLPMSSRGRERVCAHDTVKMRTKKEPFFIGANRISRAPWKVKEFFHLTFCPKSGRIRPQKEGRGSMRIMAVDYGDARTGVAVSDATGFLAGYTTVIQSRKPEFVAEEIAKLAREHGVEELVMGFPRNMDGTEGPRAELYRAFAARLEEAVGLKPVLWDERRTTIEAHDILHASGKKMKQHKKNVDAVAATLILEGYLTFKKR